jgi:hypothetical protein
MTDNNDQTRPEVDPFQAAADSLLYGSPEDAGKTLRDAIYTGAQQIQQHQARQGVIQRELASSGEVAKRFAEENPEWAKNPMIRDAIKAGMRVEQLNDLIKAGVDIGKWSEGLGRVPNENEIFNAHLELRAAGRPEVRTPEQLFDDVAGQAEETFGLRRRLRSEDANRKRAAQDRVKAAAAAHGMTVEQYEMNQLPSRMPNYTDIDSEPVTTQSIQQSTLRSFGDGVPAEADASRKANHRNAIARMQQSRAGTKLAPQVEVNRSADDRRYPDRRTG